MTTLAVPAGVSAEDSDRTSAPPDDPERTGDSTGQLDPTSESADDPGRRSDGLVEVLSVRRNLAVGAAAGLAMAMLAYLVRVLELFGPAPARGSPALFFGLALVLAVGVATLVAVVLSAVAAYRVAGRRPE